MYKTQSENAQRLLQMNEQKQQIEKKEKQSSEEYVHMAEKDCEEEDIDEILAQNSKVE